MNLAHEQIKQNVAAAIAEDAAIKAYAVAHFGRPLEVIVNRYGPDGFPGEAESPFVFIYSDGENEMGDVDEETFEFVIVVGAVDPAETPTRRRLMNRTAESSGLTVCGIAAEVEEVRRMIEAIVVTSKQGGLFRTATRVESNMLDYPLEWASLRCSYFEPEFLNQ